MDSLARATAPFGAAPFLVGREGERALLRAALAQTLARRGALVLIAGEAGIGKTALAEALLAEARDQGALVLVGHCYDLSETPPYGPWAEALAHAPRNADLPLLPAAVSPPDHGGETLGGRETIFARVRAYLAAVAAHQPLVLLLDDLHWADPASLDLLRVLGRTLADVPLLVLATYRAEEVAADHPLAVLLPPLVREARAVRLDLRPLDGAAIAALVTRRYALGDADQARLVRYLAGRTEGNALFLGELLRTLEGERLLHREGTRWALGDLEGVPMPVLLRQIIAGRLTRLHPETHRLLTIAAVVGQEVPLALWATVAEVTEEDLFDHCERATTARLLVETPDGSAVSFAHALFREALHAGMRALQRRALHRRAGEALAALSAPDPDAVAYHFQQAGDPRVFVWLVRAGVRAYHGAARVTAAARFEAAATQLAEDAERAGERGWLLYLAGEGLLFADGARALRLFDLLAPLALAAGDRALSAYGNFMRGLAHVNRGQFRLGLSAMERGLEELEKLSTEYRRWHGSNVALARLAALLPHAERQATQLPTAPVLPGALRQRGTLANWYGMSGHYRQAEALGATTIAATPDEPAFRDDAPGCWGLAHAHAALGRPEDARREYARACAECYAQHRPDMIEYALWLELQLVVLPYMADDLAERTRMATEAARAWERAAGSIFITPYPSQVDLPLALLEGRWAEARRLAEAGLAGISGHVPGAIVALGTMAYLQGEPAAAWARVHALHPREWHTEPGDCHFVLGIALQTLAANLALDAGDLALAGEWIAAQGRWLDWSGAVRGHADHRHLQARHAHLAGEATEARRLAEAALTLATEPRQPLALLITHRLLGELDTGAGRFANAAAHLNTALALADACAAPYERALTLLSLAELHAAVGEHEEVWAALGAARVLLTPLEARPGLARANALAAKLALVPSSTGYPDGLTAREVDVLRLVAAGQSNAEAATTLAVSKRTIERHLENSYRKIGARNRADATAYVLRHHLT